MDAAGASSVAPPAVRAKRGRFTVTRLHRSGPDPHRVLLVGSQSQLASSQLPRAEALGERIADRVWLRTERGVDLDMLWEARPVLSAIRQGLSAWRLWRYDAVIVVSIARPVGVLARWRAHGVTRLLQRVIREVGTASHVLVVSLQEPDEGPGGRTRQFGSAGPGSGRDPDHPAEAPRVTSMVTSLDPEEGADAVAAQLLEPLTAADSGGEVGEMDAAHRRRHRPDDEDSRQQAVDQLALQERHVQRRLQHVVELAKDAFGSISAEITVIDRDRQWTLAAAGEHRGDLPRHQSLCSRSIEHPTATLIADTWEVAALRGNPVVSGPGAIRFYAAHPLESIDGYRIGVLCVWDDVPHDVDAFDISALRDLALLAEAEIIGDAPR